MDDLEPPCTCPGPGFCERFGIHQTPHTWSRCQAADGDQELASAYRRQWRERKEGTRPLPVLAEPLAGPVTLSHGARPLEPCIHEGETLRASCCENNHVRQCRHPDVSGSQCSRRPTAPGLPACSQCPHRAGVDGSGPLVDPDQPVTRPRVLCRHLDQETLLDGAQQQALGLTPLRRYYACARGHGTGGWVCLCRGQCGPLCVDYQPGEPLDTAL